MVESRLPLARPLVEAGNLAVLKGLEQKVRIKRFRRRCNVFSLAGVTPGINHISVPDHTSERAGVVTQLLELLCVQADLLGFPGRPLFARVY